MKDKRIRYQFRRRRVAAKLGRRTEHPRLSVHRSDRYLYAQVVDDNTGQTLAFASSLSREIRGGLRSGKNLTAAKAVGELIAKKAIAAGVKRVRFDRQGRQYHGRIQALADAARQAGLEF